MKIIRPVEVTDSIVTENTAYPPEVNAWQASGFAVIPSDGDGKALTEMAFSGSQDRIFIALDQTLVYCVSTSDSQIFNTVNISTPLSVASEPVGSRVAITFTNNLYILDSSLGLVAPLDSNATFGVSSVTKNKVFWCSSGIIWYVYGTSGANPGHHFALIGDSSFNIVWQKTFATTDMANPDVIWAGDGGVLVAIGTSGFVPFQIRIYNSSNGAVVDAFDTTSRNFGGAVINSTQDTVYYTLRGTSGDGRGLYKASGVGFDTKSTIEQPVGLPTEPGALRINGADTQISVSTGFDSHILDTSNDTWVSGTSRAKFKTNENTPPIEFSRNDSLIAVGPQQPDDLGVYNLWETTGWTQITADQSDYLAGDTVYQDKSLYESLVDTPTQSPKNGTDADPPQWVRLGAINPWRMFDGATNTQTSGATPMTISFEPGVLVNGIAFFSVDAGTLQVTMTDPVEGLVYDSGEIQMLDNSAINDWYAYFFEPYVPRPDLALLDLPPYPDATITVTLTSEGQDINVGEIVFGSIQRLGAAQYGTSVGIIDFSRKEQDQFGNFSILQRRFSKRAEYDVKINTGAASGVQRTLANYRTTPVVWVGDENKDETIVYGYYRDFEILLSGPSLSDCTITVEGL